MKKHITMRIDENLLRKIDKQIDINMRTRTGIIETLLEKSLKGRKKCRT